MTQIGNRGHNPSAQGQAGFAHDRAFAEGRLADTRGSNASHEAKAKPGARTMQAQKMDDRLSAFERSMHRATSTEGDETAEAKLLATAEWSGSAFATPMPQPPAAEGDVVATPAAETFASQIARRIEQVVRADLIALATSGATTIDVDLSGLAGGLQQLNVTMSATALDVTFTHAMDTLPDELVQATQALAEQLARRFTGRTVRILEARAASSADADAGEGGLRAISGLFGRMAEQR